LEALASGVPVITSKSFSPGNILLKHISQVDNVTPARIAEKIQEVILEGYKVNVEEVKKDYDWMVIAKRIQSIYQDVMK